tara:strand:- start:22 stop:651 length:630 start_codon:yes stop_codon:yes gene_type:complete
MIQTSFFPQPEKNEPIKIIQIEPSGFPPMKVEEIKYRNCNEVIPDSYMLYPTGGFHPFYGTPNTFPLYQLPVWPFVKRIKWEKNGKWMKKKQLMPSLNSKSDYAELTLKTTNYFTENKYTQKNKNGLHYINEKSPKSITLQLHKLIANAWIPNPENKPQVMHINDDPTNYLPENLKWGTPGENMKGVKRHQGTLEQKYLSLIIKGIIKG